MNANQILRLLESGATDIHSALGALSEEVRDDMISDLRDMLIEQAKRSLTRIKSEKMTNAGYMTVKYKEGGLPGAQLISLSDNPYLGLLDWEQADLKGDHEAIAEKLATRATDEILKNFRAKVILKLEKVGTRLGRPEVEILSSFHSRGKFEAELEFTFGKASFQVKTQVVSVWNQNGTAFTRFPLTFHDVVLSDGSKMKSPSENKMSTDFK